MLWVDVGTMYNFAQRYNKSNKTHSRQSSYSTGISIDVESSLLHIAPGVIFNPVEGDRTQEGLWDAEGINEIERLRPKLATKRVYFGVD